MNRNQSLRQTAQPTADHLKKIIELQSRLVSADFDLCAFMNTLVEEVQALTHSTGAVIELLDGDEMIYKAGCGSIGANINLSLKAANSLSGLCVRTGEILHSDDTRTDPRVDSAACKRVNALSMVVVPLYRNGESIGVLKIVSALPSAFSAADIQTLQLMAGLLGGALGQQLEVDARRQAEEQLQQLALHDPLTGLPNRQLFYDRLAHAMARQRRSKQLLAIMYMDIDHFKAVNDTYGHAVGDALLQGFGERVRVSIRASDTLARFGGDEFVLIAEGFNNRQDVENIANKIIAAMRPVFMLEGQSLTISTSIGIAIASGAESAADELVGRADKALYEAKKAGRNRFSLIAA